MARKINDPVAKARARALYEDAKTKVVQAQRIINKLPKGCSERKNLENDLPRLRSIERAAARTIDRYK